VSARQEGSWILTDSICQVLDDSYEPLLALGFEISQSFEQIINSPENVGAVQNGEGISLLTEEVLGVGIITTTMPMKAS
jgi:hypothetical protein